MSPLDVLVPIHAEPVHSSPFTDPIRRVLTLNIFVHNRLSASASPEKGQRSPRGLSDDDMDDSEDTQVRRQLPCEDFSLKTAVCFRSSRPFDWCRAIPSVIEARALMTRAAMVPPPLDQEGRLQADDTPFRCVPCLCPNPSLSNKSDIVT